MSFKLITVGIADIKVASPPDILRTILGSCVGICLFDKKNSIGGLAHIMLPRINERSLSKKKYADSAIPLLLEEMERLGAAREVIIAKIVGGATMFKMSDESNVNNIGQSNITAVKDILKELNIKIIAEELGGEYGRTIDFYVDTGMVKIKTMNKQIKII